MPLDPHNLPADLVHYLDQSVAAADRVFRQLGVDPRDPTVMAGALAALDAFIALCNRAPHANPRDLLHGYALTLEYLQQHTRKEPR